jgi:hypothetical protein
MISELSVMFLCALSARHGTKQLKLKENKISAFFKKISLGLFQQNLGLRLHRHPYPFLRCFLLVRLPLWEPLIFDNMLLAALCRKRERPRPQRVLVMGSLFIREKLTCETNFSRHLKFAIFFEFAFFCHI